MTVPSRAKTIAALNDTFRQTFTGGTVLITAGVLGLEPGLVHKFLLMVKAYEGFNKDDDPREEHDFGCIELNGEKVFWKIDYYAPGMTAGAEDPADQEKTTRVLTIMLASEY